MFSCGTRVALCSFEGPWRPVSRPFPVALARGKHLFPFRTEKLSPSAPMVLGSQEPGRVGRRRFLHTSRPSGRLVFVVSAGATPARALTRRGGDRAGETGRASRRAAAHRRAARAVAATHVACAGGCA